MKGVVVNYRGGARTQKTNQMIILPENCSKKEDAVKLVGKKVKWTTPSGKKIMGKITKPHGRKGAVVVRFNKGLPGQALGTEVEIGD
ncbi:MAG: 50S ribosomal protein L35ae [Candidatus Altiarchaeales archaeon]|nr:MAG: 50S ribosomal protein L35ae [Candidatus Altiarchaeales archaeon]RLI95019.1 MAG: 50S ribosomal protein L35ae [Candidatus Altiarchaeales archaeon]HDO82377.1 50S ribosomal protein L35ae [Candidatus Altiarchaeales archaeon]HEX55026.1 50S ribosomal protein L35ae [Candidatus Altiarchaeales archaeon]